MTTDSAAADDPGRRLLAADALAVALTPLELEADDVVDGAPTAFDLELLQSGDVTIGIWELSAGVVRDTEVDEVFVVLRGRGEVTFEDGEALSLIPGTVVHLRAGDRTEWAVTEHLRKLYVVLP